MASWTFDEDGKRVLLRRTKIAGRDNIQDLPKKKPAKAKAKKTEVKDK
jgi:hypothetical protein